MLTLRPLELVVYWVCKGHCAQISLGKWITPPGTKGISCSAGHLMICCSQSRVNACLGKRLVSRTGQALQYTSRSSLRSRTKWLLKYARSMCSYAQKDLLSIQIDADRFRHTGFR